MIDETLKDYDIDWTVRKVPSEENKADVLTRVPKQWLSRSIASAVVGPAATLERKAAERAHDSIHRGVKATLMFAKELLPSVTESDAKLAVQTCEQCASISPHPVDLGEGHLDVSGTWDRIAADVTHVGADKFLTVIDCGPSRYTVWKKIRHEDAATVAEGLEEVFRILGPPTEAIFDNGLAFRSSMVRLTCDKWKVNIHFRCADRPSGNAIVERCHRTVKEMAARRGGSVLDAVVMYNLVPRHVGSKAPAELLMGRTWNKPLLHQQLDRPALWSETNRHGPFDINDAVWVRPPRARCNDQWREGRVTGIVSDRNIEVDGVPRHPKDLRRRSEGWHHKQNVRSERPTGGGGIIPLQRQRNGATESFESDEGGDVLDDTEVTMEGVGENLEEEVGVPGSDDNDVQEQL